MLKSFSIVIMIVVTSSSCFSQIKNNYKYKSWEEGISTVQTEHVNDDTITKKKYKIGFNSGYHSQYLSKNNSLDFNGDVLLELYIGFSLSDEVYLLTGYTYWKAQTKQINSPGILIPSETINSNAFKLGIEFSLIKIYDASFLLEPSISIGNLTRATNTIFSFGTDFKLSIPLSKERFNLFTAVAYRNGFEILNFGGGIGYSFYGISAGFEIII